MIHLGDITKINGAVSPIVDCVIGGSPCQDLSIAGKRAGLAGERSGLYMDQIRIIKEMRHNDRANGRTGEFIRPRYMVWENVPGAFSSNNGKDFSAVLEEAVKIAEPEAPPVPVPEKGWPTSGCLMGDGWSLAWRVLDAQFWGVPQRRRRIALVADFGGQSAPEILFVRKGVSGDTQPGKPQGKRPAGGAENSAAYAVRLQGNGIDRANSAGQNGGGWRENVAYTLNTIDRPVVCAGFKLGNSEKARSIGYCEEQAPTLNAECGGNKPAGLCLNDQGGAVTVFDPQQITIPVNRSRPEPGKPCHTLTSSMGAGSGNVPTIFRQKEFGDYCQDDVAGTCKARDRGDGTGNIVQNAMTVRRLTPMECERLQGFPDGWTDIGDWTDSKGKKRKTTDAARYKALGNSIALPPWKWVLKRLCAQYERDATMASLFDGIGGFPLIWERLNGKDSCLWSSEIEEFPMAVTRKRFGGLCDE